MYVLKVFILQLLILQSICIASSITKFSEIEEFLIKNPHASLENLLDQLSPEVFKKNYNLVFSSRSPNPTSLENPRIILTNSDGSLILAFSSNPNLQRGNVMEVIELDQLNNFLKFKEIVFSKTDQVKIDNNPQSCIACHGTPESKRLRPIWDTYPDWVGSYGSSHNDIISKRGNEGISKIRDLEFEINAFERLKANSKNNDRLNTLIDFQNATLSSLADKNTSLNEIILRLNTISILGQVIDVIKDKNNDPNIRKIITNTIYGFYGKSSYSLSKKNPIYILGRKKYNEIKTLIREGRIKYYTKKNNRLKDIVQKYGTINDKNYVFNELDFSNPLSVNKDNVEIGKGYVENGHFAVFLYYLMDELKLDPQQLAPTFGSSTFGLDGPLNNVHHLYFFDDALVDFLNNKTHKGNCYILLRNRF